MVIAEQDMDEDYRHWSPESQPIATADIVLQYMKAGWRLHDRVLVEIHALQGICCVELVYFALLRGDERLSVPVVMNPVVLRLIHDHELRLFRLTTRRDCPDQPAADARRRSEQTPELFELIY